MWTTTWWQGEGNGVETKRESCLTQAHVARAGIAVVVHGWAGRRYRTWRDTCMHGLRMSRCAFMQAHRSRLASLQHVLAHVSSDDIPGARGAACCSSTFANR